jgi:hypothetical protein
MSRFPHFLGNQLADGGEVVSLNCSLASRKIPGPHFCYRLNQPQDHSVAGRIKSAKKSTELTGNRNRNLPACSTVPQPTMLLLVLSPC